jgi:hypothetical protein
VQNKPRSGHPEVLTEREKRYITTLIRAKPLIPWEDLRKELGLSVSITTIRKFLKNEGVLHWRALKRPGLTKELAIKRLAWAREHANTDWSKWLFSDECSVEYGVGRARPWAFGFNDEKLTPERVFPLNKGKQASVMIWGMIGASINRSEVVIMDRDPESRRNGVSALSYLWTLEEHLMPLYNGQVFQQDNAPIHTAQMVKQWFEEHGILWCQSWPSYSPDLNPIEHVWTLMKRLIYDKEPFIMKLSRSRQLEVLLREIPRAWVEIQSEVIDSLVSSMKQRVQAVIDAQGWYTHY